MVNVKRAHAPRQQPDVVGLLSRVRESAASESGQTVTEYGAVVAILIIALSGVVFALQGSIASFIDNVASALAAILP